MSARRRKTEIVERESLKETIENQKKKIDNAFESVKNIFRKKEKEEAAEKKKLTREEKIRTIKDKIKDKYNSINKYKFIGVSLSIILGIVAIYFITNYHLYGLNMIKTLTQDDAILYTTMTSDNIIREYGEYILIIDNNTMTAINRYGKVAWTKTLNESFTPHVSIAGRYIQLANYDTGRVYVYDSKYEVARIEIGKTIQNSYINENGVSVVQYNVPGAKTTMSVYNASGKEVKRINLDTASVVNVCVSGNRYLAYTYIDMSGVSIISSCAIVDLKTDSINNIWTENNAILYDAFWNNNKLYARLNDVVLVYNASNGKLKRYDTYGLNANFIDIDEDQIAILTTTENLGYNFSLMNYGKELKFKAYIEEPPISFKYEGDLAYICAKKDIFVFSKYGINAKNINLDLTISEWIVFNYGKSVCVISGNELLIFNV